MNLKAFITKQQRLNHGIVIFSNANNHKNHSLFHKLKKDLDLIGIVAQDIGTHQPRPLTTVATALTTYCYHWIWPLAPLYQ